MLSKLATAAVGLSTFAKADQPVHCLRQEVYGDWTFHISKESESVNLFDVAEVCTHQLPNGVQFINNDFKFSFAQESTMKVSLKDNYRATATIDG